MRMQAAGVPTVPGSDGLIKDEEEALYYADKVQSLIAFLICSLRLVTKLAP